VPPNNDLLYPIITQIHDNGGHLFDGDKLFDATNSNTEELEEWTSQLDNIIHLEMKFTFESSVEEMVDSPVITNGKDQGESSFLRDEGGTHGRFANFLP